MGGFCNASIGARVLRCLTQKLRHMLRYGWIGRIAEAHFHQSGAALLLRSRVGLDNRKEAIQQDGARFLASQFGADSSANQSRASPEDSDRCFIGTNLDEQFLLGGAALLPQRMELNRVELCFFQTELMLDVAGKREIHV